MRILADTQCWLWMQSDPDQFSKRARKVIENADNTIYLSAASAWEISIKYALGKLPLPVPPSQYVPSRLERSGTTPLPITIEHTLHVAALPPHHRDPFDRLLVSQCLVDGLTLLSADRQLDRYEVDVLWAR